MAQFVHVPERCLHKLPDHLDIVKSALMEPLAAVCNAVLDPNKIEPGDLVLVTGPGPVGLLAAQVARACGARVIVAGQERDRARLDIAEGLGFTVSLSDRESLEQEGVEAPDVLLECSGAQAAMALGLQLVRKGGRIVRIGVAGKAVTIPLDEMCYRELTLSSGFASTPHSWRRALSLAGAGQVLLDPIVTQVAPLSAWRGVFDDTRAAVGGKYVFDPRLEN
jgi:L-iditol 2-dehydrogenase